MGIKAGNIPTSSIDSTDYFLITEGEAPKRVSYPSVKVDIIGNETLTTTAQSVKGAINENKTNIDLKANNTDNARTTTAKDVTGAINEINASLSEKAKQTDLTQLSNPSLLINDCFQVWQRGISFTPIASSAYSVDRWICYGVTNNINVIKVSNGLKIQKISASASGILQYIEKVFPLGTKLTLSAKIDGVINSVSGVLTTSSTKVTISNVEIAFSSNGTNSFLVAITPIDTLEHTIEFVKFELGSIATPFVPRLYAEELALCQRYYQIVTKRFRSIYASASTSCIPWQFIVPMRTTPTISSKNALPSDFALETRDNVNCSINITVANNGFSSDYTLVLIADSEIY